MKYILVQQYRIHEIQLYHLLHQDKELLYLVAYEYYQHHLELQHLISNEMDSIHDIQFFLDFLPRKNYFIYLDNYERIHTSALIRFSP